MTRYDTLSVPAAPSFLEARNRRQKARAAGMHPDYWYPVEWSRNLKRGKAMGTRFWGRPIAVFRDDNGQVHALEDRCAHRQVKLSLGQVDGCNLRCMYHGWAFSGDGKLAAIPHDLFGRPFPAQIKVGSYPVQERYGLIWIFPGDPEVAKTRKLPEIPELEGKSAWSCIPVDFTWRAHHSMVIDNVSDFTHEYLHRRSRPFANAKLTKLESVEDKVYVSYDTQVGTGRISGLFVPRDRINTDHMDLCYEYPFQWSNTDDKIKHHCFVLPLDEKNTRSFFIFYFRTLRLPVVPLTIPTQVMNLIMPIAKRVLVKPLLREDGDAVVAEQEGYDQFYESPIAEFNPAVSQFQQLTIRKWEEYLAQVRGRGAGGGTSGESPDRGDRSERPGAAERGERGIHSAQLRVQP
jgi:hypothetical protein